MTSFLYGVISGAYSTGTGGGTGGGTTPTCTATCGQWSITYGEWSGYSPCSGGTQTRTRTVSGTKTCTASDCSTYQQTSNDPTVLGLSADATSQTIACGSTTTWYCKTNTGGTFTSTSDQTGGEPCVSWTKCSTTSYPNTPQVPC